MLKDILLRITNGDDGICFVEYSLRNNSPKPVPLSSISKAKENKTMLGENLFVKTAGLSMFPFIRDGDKVIVKKISAKDLRIGDIILFKDNSNGKTICHRLVRRIKKEGRLMFFTRGDSGSALSSPVPEDRLIGRVIGIIRKGKILNLRTKSQIIINWLTAKFYIFFKRILIFVFEALQKFSFYRKISKKFFSNRIEYRQILKEDNENVDFGDFQMEGELKNESSFQFEAVYKDLQAAFVTLREAENSFCKGWWISSFFVRTPFHGAGIGEKLMQRVIQFARNKNIPSLHLIVDEPNALALNLYCKLGFKEVNRGVSEVYREKSSTYQIVMRLDLSAPDVR